VRPDLGKEVLRAHKFVIRTSPGFSVLSPRLNLSVFSLASCAGFVSPVSLYLTSVSHYLPWLPILFVPSWFVRLLSVPYSTFYRTRVATFSDVFKTCVSGNRRASEAAP